MSTTFPLNPQRRTWARTTATVALCQVQLHALQQKQALIRSPRQHGGPLQAGTVSLSALTVFKLIVSSNFCGLLYGEVCRFGAPQDLVREGGRVPEEIRKVRPVRYEAASLHILPVPIHRGQPVSCREVCEFVLGED